MKTQSKFNQIQFLRIVHDNGLFVGYRIDEFPDFS